MASSKSSISQCKAGRPIPGKHQEAPFPNTLSHPAGSWLSQGLRYPENPRMPAAPQNNWSDCPQVPKCYAQAHSPATLQGIPFCAYWTACHSKTVTTPKREHRSECAEAAQREGRAHEKLLGNIMTNLTVCRMSVIFCGSLNGRCLA